MSLATAAMFKTDDNGRRVIFPYGMLGRGYVLPDTSAEQKAERGMSALMAGAMAVCWIGFGVLRVLFGQPETWTLRAWSALIGASVVYLVLYHIAARRLTRGLTKSPLLLGVIDIAQRQAHCLAGSSLR
jgi:hypothetical protein